jgi:hypothetical protein
MYYVYRIKNKETGVFYIGFRRTSKENPLDDIGIKYFTSGKLKDHFKSSPSSYEIDILFVSEKRKDAFAEEQKLIKKNILNNLNRNFSYDGCSLKKMLHIKSNKAKQRPKDKVPDDLTITKKFEKKIWDDATSSYKVVDTKTYERWLNVYKSKSKKRDNWRHG